jgi:hypothetical protein
LDISAKFSLIEVADKDLTYDFQFPNLPLTVTNPLDNSVSTLTVDLNQFYPDRKTSTVFGDNPAPVMTPSTDGIDGALKQALGYAGWDDDAINFFVSSSNPAYISLRDSLIANSQFQSVPGIGLGFFGLAMPQVSVGLPLKSEVMVRMLPTMKVGDFGDVSFLGIGLKHNVSQYIPVPLFPVDISAQFVWQQLKIGTLLESKHTAFNVEASKKLGLPFLSLTPYVGLGIEHSTLKVSYVIEGSGTLLDGQPVGFDLTGDNNFRATGGVRLGLAFLTINADYSMGAYNTASLGLGLTLR